MKSLQSFKCLITPAAKHKVCEERTGGAWKTTECGDGYLQYCRRKVFEKLTVGKPQANLCAIASGISGSFSYQIVAAVSGKVCKETHHVQITEDGQYQNVKTFDITLYVEFQNIRTSLTKKERKSVISCVFIVVCAAWTLQWMEENVEA